MSSAALKPHERRHSTIRPRRRFPHTIGHTAGAAGLPAFAISVPVSRKRGKRESCGHRRSCVTLPLRQLRTVSFRFPARPASPHSSVDRAPASGAGRGRSSRPGGTQETPVDHMWSTGVCITLKYPPPHACDDKYARNQRIPAWMTSVAVVLSRFWSCHTLCVSSPAHHWRTSDARQGRRDGIFLRSSGGPPFILGGIIRHWSARAHLPHGRYGWRARPTRTSLPPSAVS